MAIMTRVLGGTGADVTILGYGAMELRGRPAHLAGNIAVAERGPLPAEFYEEAKKHLPLPEARASAAAVRPSPPGRERSGG